MYASLLFAALCCGFAGNPLETFLQPGAEREAGAYFLSGVIFFRISARTGARSE